MEPSVAQRRDALRNAILRSDNNPAEWIEYIKFERHVCGGSPAGILRLKAVLRAAVENIEVSKHRTSQELLDIWLELAEVQREANDSPDAIRETYNHIRAAKFGGHRASLLYLKWADFERSVGSLDRAKAALTAGIAARTEGVESLEEALLRLDGRGKQPAALRPTFDDKENFPFTSKPVPDRHPLRPVPAPSAEPHAQRPTELAPLIPGARHTVEKDVDLSPRTAQIRAPTQPEPAPRLQPPAVPRIASAGLMGGRLEAMTRTAAASQPLAGRPRREERRRIGGLGPPKRVSDETRENQENQDDDEGEKSQASSNSRDSRTSSGDRDDEETVRPPKQTGDISNPPNALAPLDSVQRKAPSSSSSVAASEPAAIAKAVEPFMRRRESPIEEKHPALPPLPAATPRSAPAPPPVDALQKPPAVTGLLHPPATAAVPVVVEHAEVPSTPYSQSTKRDDPNALQSALGSAKSFITVNAVPYTRLSVVGRGGSSKVYKVLSPTGEVLALKKVNLASADRMAVEGYLNEISLLKKLAGNKRIIRRIDSEVDRENGVILMVMECGETDLANVLKRNGKLSVNFIRMYWEQMLEAVQAIHEHNIVHTDLKPANFLLVEGALKLIDFGIAKSIPNDTTNIHREHQTGTVNYMSPESIADTSGQKRDYLKLGRPSDVWSLGCVLYEFLHGRPPFYHFPSLMAKMHAIAYRSDQISYPEIDGTTMKEREAELAQEVLRGCLKRDPRERMTIPELLAHGFLRGGGVANGTSGRVDAANVTDVVKEVLRVFRPGVAGMADEVAKTLLRQIRDDRPLDLSAFEGR